MPTRRVLLGAMATLCVLPAAFADDVTQEERQRLFDRLRTAPSEREGRLAEQAIWQMWMRTAPHPSIGQAVEQAMRARESYDYDRSLALLDNVVADAPDYAEGWNQRAFVRFMKQDFDGALEDIEQAIFREPKHFAALAGKARILMQQGRMELGQKALRQAVAIHPWLRERSMLVPLPGEQSPGRDRNQGKDI